MLSRLQPRVGLARAGRGRQRGGLAVHAAKGFGAIKQKFTPKDYLQGREPMAPHPVSPPRPVPAGIARPPYADSGKLPGLNDRWEVHDAAGVAKMRASCQLAARVLQHAGSLVAPGVTTDAIDAAVHEMVVGAGAYPSPLNYGKFPKSVCTSVNEVLCHGIPDARPLKDGDIVNIDVTVFLDGYHGDTSAMFYVGTPSPTAKRLCEATREALEAAIKVCGPDVPVRAIGEAIVEVAQRRKFQVSRDFIGHGVGRVFHAAPHVMHVKNSERDVMPVNATFTIEPILTEGSPRMVEWRDKWTAATADGSLAAQMEHTVLITPGGAEVLTLP